MITLNRVVTDVPLVIRLIKVIAKYNLTAQFFLMNTGFGQKDLRLANYNVLAMLQLPTASW